MNTESKKNPDIAIYDKYKYDYSKFWQNRSYEHNAEIVALNKLLKHVRGKWFIDIGGSYGRHIPSYYEKFDHIVIADYSINSLKQAQKKLQDNNIKNIHLVGANLYNLPFKTEIFDGAIMIRVLHHIEKIELAIKEISRILTRQSHFILEFPNKNHLKAIIMAILKHNARVLISQDRNRLETSKKPEGTNQDTPGIIINFSPDLIKKTLISNGFIIENIVSLSFFRISLIKNLLPVSILNIIERIFQICLSWTMITPSIMYKVTKKQETKHDDPKFNSIESILCCPKCKGILKHNKDIMLCTDCKNVYPVKNNIYDLRYPILHK